MSNIYGSGAKGRATKLHAEIVRSRGRCEKCGSAANLQCSHIISRKYSHVRTDERNAHCLCASCHRIFTDNPVEFARWLDQVLPAGLYDELREKSQRRTKVDWDVELERLRGLARTP